MCGRFALERIPRELLRALGLTAPDMKPRFSIAPTQTVPVVVLGLDDRPVLAPMRWGLVPSWAKDESFAARTINARAETVDSKPTFREAFRRRRCLVPATGFFEWKKEASVKGGTPFFFTPADGADGMAFAGLWERWHDLHSFTIVTTAANADVAPVHDRMPVIVERNDWPLWLDGSAKEAGGLLRPAADGALLASHVNNSRNDD